MITDDWPATVVSKPGSKEIRKPWFLAEAILADLDRVLGRAAKGGFGTLARDQKPLKGRLLAVSKTTSIL